MNKLILFVCLLLSIALMASILMRYTDREERMHHFFEKDTTILFHTTYNAIHFRKEGNIIMIDTTLAVLKQATVDPQFTKDTAGHTLYMDADRRAVLAPNGRTYILPVGKKEQRFVASRDTALRISGDTVYLPSR